MQDFATLLGNAVAEGMTKNQPKKKTFGQYTRERNAGRLKLTRTCFQNGFHLDEMNLSNKEIQGLNGIDHTGRYLDRFVQIIVREEGADAVVEIRYPCKSQDQRNEAATRFRSLEHLLEQVTAAQDIERAEAAEVEEHKVAARRKFGDTKAYRDAVANAATK